VPACGARDLEVAHHSGAGVAVDDVDADPEAVIVALLALAQLRIGLGIHEAGVRIERLEHAVDGAVDDAVRLDRLDVSLLDLPERGGEDVHANGEYARLRQVHLRCGQSRANRNSFCTDRLNTPLS